MPDQQDTLAAKLAGDHVNTRTKPENDVAPAFAAGRTVVELAQQAAKLGLLRVQSGYAGVSQPVQNAELFFAQPLVHNQRIFFAL